MWYFLEVRKGLDWMSYYLIRACEEPEPTGMLFTAISQPPAHPLTISCALAIMGIVCLFSVSVLTKTER